MNDNRPIGVFDSGIGGLTVLKELIKSFPNETFIYLGDTARLPYGSKTKETIRRYLQQNVEFLLKANVKAVVVACNSASSVLSKELNFPVPVLGVIRPGAFAAIEKTRNNVVTVLATRATIQGESYQKELKDLNPNIKVIAKACPLLVPLVEEGMNDDEVTTEMVRRYVQEGVNQKSDTFILGCTHYPLLIETFTKVLGPSVTIVDSAKVLAKNLRQTMDKHIIHSNQGPGEGHHIYLTDIMDHTTEMAKRVLHPANIEKIMWVNL